MKILYLLSSRIKQYFRTNKLIFLLFITGSILASVMFAYFYGNLRPIMANRNSQDTDYRSYAVVSRLSYSVIDSVRPEKPDNTFSAETVETLAADPMIEVVWAGLDDIEDDGFPFGSYLRACVSGNDTQKTVIKGKNVFDEGNPYQIIVPKGSKKKVGDTVEMLGQTYRVIGVLDPSYGGYYVPYEACKAIAEGEFTVLSVLAAERQDPENDLIYERLLELFPNGNVIDSYYASAVDRLESENNTILIILCYLLAMISFAALLRYLVDSQITESVISRMVGATRSKVTLLIFGETFLLSACSCGIGLMLHKLLYKIFFERINMEPDLVYEPHDYLVMFFIMLMIVFVTVLPAVLKYRKLTPAESVRSRD